jgi:hypothetical protein
MEEECSSKRGMRTRMENILNGGAKSDKVSSDQSPPCLVYCFMFPLTS